MKKYFAFLLSAIIFVSCNSNGDKSSTKSSDSSVIGTWNLKNGETVSAFPGDLKNQHI